MNQENVFTQAVPREAARLEAARREADHLYRLVDFWNDIRNGKHDDYLNDLERACLKEIAERRAV